MGERRCQADEKEYVKNPLVQVPASVDRYPLIVIRRPEQGGADGQRAQGFPGLGKNKLEINLFVEIGAGSDMGNFYTQSSCRLPALV